MTTKVNNRMIEGAVLNILDFGAVGDGITDNTSALQAAYNQMSDGDKLYIPEGNFKVKAESSDDVITWDINNASLEMIGWISLLPNSEGYTPNTIINVTGDNNKLIVNFENIDDVPKKPSDASNENPNNGIYLRGENNTVTNSRVFNFVGCYRIGGTDNKVLDSKGTARSISNLAWTNDVATFFFSNNGLLSRVTGGVYDSSNPYGVTLENHPLRETSLCRTGLTIDAQANFCTIENCTIGEGFVGGIHSEGSGERNNLITNNYVYSQKRNAINAAAGPLTVSYNYCEPVLNINDSGNPLLVGTIGSITDDVIVKGNTVKSDDNTTICFKALSVKSAKVLDNYIYGDYDKLFEVLAGQRPEFSRNIHLEGSASIGVEYSKAAEANNENRLQFKDNTVRVTTRMITCSSGGKVTAQGNTCLFEEGYVPIVSDGYILISGNPSDSGQDPHLAKFIINDNTFFYVGTTPIAGNTYLIRSDATSTEPEGVFISNVFDESIAFRLIAGGQVNPAKWYAAGNSTDSIV